MAKLEGAMKEAIVRGARKQLRVVVVPLRRDVVRLRRKVLEMNNILGSLKQSAMAWERRMDGVSPVPPVSEEEAKGARLSPRLIQSLRKRLGLSQMALARLVGVSAPAVSGAADHPASERIGVGASDGRRTASAAGLGGRGEVCTALAPGSFSSAGRPPPTGGVWDTPPAALLRHLRPLGAWRRQ
jgi:hypothetical protein